jgi:glycosyltransferase involved in cell wall biosynthesis
MKISAYVLTKNSEKIVRGALESVKWADEIVVSDGFSTDKTVEICKKYTDMIYRHKFEGFGEERNFAISKCTGDWIVEIDADEIYSKELQESIQERIRSNPKADAYRIRRRDYFLKRYLTTLKIIRVYRRGSVEYVGATHERPILKGKEGGILRGFAEHKTSHYDSMSYVLRELDSDIELEFIKRFKGKDIGRLRLALSMAFRPLYTFLTIYFLKGYFRSGMTGLVWCINNSFYEFLVYARYYERKYIYGTMKARKDKIISLKHTEG